MRRAFTLMELMVVVGIMAFLGVAATGGYNALQRGIAERGAVDAASALLKAAKERAMVDRVPTAVFCYNRMVREATDDENAIVVGEAVAIRRAGRITRVQGNYLYDEFGDLDRSYDRKKPSQQSDLQSRKGMRLWRFDDRDMSRMQYSVVSDAVLDDDDVPGVSFTSWSNQLDDDDNNTQSGNGTVAQELKNGDLKIRACAFFNLGKSDHEPPSWQVGNGYGFEFMTLRLPNGFIFKNAVPSSVGDIVQTGAFVFNPANFSENETIDIWACMTGASGVPQAHHKAGTASSDGDKAK
ncbi:MAG: prepilin-type N-terminal cleavage/methylation domain-containing protein [Kiritimatiellae bacterium]|nr:prepilin-type N-terminal cleavage/methylation domain-containing protein [Kiritimatiellia bacterium]MBQ3344036.1 prepilin-type N-terminal cleavage/methylation domain-containing protein [Kiritimatiellia bacterium]MBQ6328212.1 prepilin-type N-terminal cleavage/methylation domain-containing protein [Kiritimatiellia bacterium]